MHLENSEELAGLIKKLESALLQIEQNTNETRLLLDALMQYFQANQRPDVAERISQHLAKTSGLSPSSSAPSTGAAPPP